MVIWIMGLSASGKTTLAEYIYKKLKPEHNNLVLVDGDMLREIMNNDLGHTVEDRFKNAHRLTRLCKQLDDQGINVICAVLSIFHESQEWNRKNVKKYFEVYIKSDIQSLAAKRDYKDIYKKALRGQIKNVVGVDIAYPEPKCPDMVITNDSTIEDLHKTGDAIIEKIKPILD
jgi:adenylyl-sulfate kinase